MNLWYPYTQMKTADPFPVVVKTCGVEITLENGSTLIDGISSWWTAIHGYNHPKLNGELIQQTYKVAHIMLGGLSHRPAIELAKKLVQIAPEGLQHVFFSESGSVAVEISLKMAIQYWKNSGYKGKNKIVSLKNGYHGDTFKAMEVSDDSDFSAAFAEVLNKEYILDSPKGGYHAGMQELAQDIEALENLFAARHQHIAAFIAEPVMQCAGGFKIYSPTYLNHVRRLCDKYNVLLIFDEVATGFGRTGKLFATNHTQISPDILILGKALTAGYLGHAATIANSKVFNAFLSDNYKEALMHGPTYMGNPLACAIALKSIEIFEYSNYLEKIRQIELIIRKEFKNIHTHWIKEKRVLGAMGAIEVFDKECLEGFVEFAIENGVWLRPIGNVVYLTPPYTIKENELRAIILVLKKWFL